MPWQEASTMALREEFVALAAVEGANGRALCRQFQVQSATAYKWLGRAAAGEALTDRSRRPHTSPRRTPAALEAAILALRDAHPTWGGRKRAARLTALGQRAVPSASTITAILERHGRIRPEASAQARAFTRCEHEAPNRLWQMDCKGPVPLAAGAGRCHPLTVLDDHSRFALGLEACANEQAATVQDRLTTIFRRYGLPDRILCDNGAPWGDAGDQPHTILTAWLLRIGIAVSHGRPYHPQTQGKDERFHRTLKAEVLSGPPFPHLAASQEAFDRWRTVYTCERPHQALGLVPPASRYRLSDRPFPTVLPPVEYGPDDQRRSVQPTGLISFQGQLWRVGKAFRGQVVAVRPTTTAGRFDVYFCAQHLTTLDLSAGPPHAPSDA